MRLLRDKRKNSTRVHESNYAKLLYVIPALKYLQRDSLLAVKSGTQSINLSVLERTRYTTAINLCVQYVNGNPWLPQQQLTVRLYHDARVAEVTGFQDHYRFDPAYEYPNPRMYHRNEKQQLNSFLGEWLDYCIRNQYIFNDACASIDA
jgi:uncharacterized protein YqiB (DUF1249 family)